MTIFGLTIAEIITLLTAAVALILTISNAGKRDVETESVEVLLEPLLAQIHQLQDEIATKDKAFIAYKTNSQKWKTATTKKLKAVTDELSKVREELEKDID